MNVHFLNQFALMANCYKKLALPSDDTNDEHNFLNQTCNFFTLVHMHLGTIAMKRKKEVMTCTRI